MLGAVKHIWSEATFMHDISLDADGADLIKKVKSHKPTDKHEFIKTYVENHVLVAKNPRQPLDPNRFQKEGFGALLHKICYVLQMIFSTSFNAKFGHFQKDFEAVLKEVNKSNFEKAFVSSKAKDDAEVIRLRAAVAAQEARAEAQRRLELEAQEAARVLKETQEKLATTQERVAEFDKDIAKLQEEIEAEKPTDVETQSFVDDEQKYQESERDLEAKESEAKNINLYLKLDDKFSLLSRLDRKLTIETKDQLNARLSAEAEEKKDYNNLKLIYGKKTNSDLKKMVRMLTQDVQSLKAEVEVLDVKIKTFNTKESVIQEKIIKVAALIDEKEELETEIAQIVKELTKQGDRSPIAIEALEVNEGDSEHASRLGDGSLQGLSSRGSEAGLEEMDLDEGDLPVEAQDVGSAAQVKDERSVELQRMIKDIESRSGEKIATLWQDLFDVFEKHYKGFKLIKNWEMDGQGNFKLELTQPLKLWMPSRKLKPGVVMLLGDNKNSELGKNQNTLKGSLKQFEMNFKSGINLYMHNTIKKEIDIHNPILGFTFDPKTNEIIGSSTFDLKRVSDSKWFLAPAAFALKAFAGKDCESISKDYVAIMVPRTPFDESRNEYRTGRPIEDEVQEMKDRLKN